MKKLIICLDGTWNDDRKGLKPTNVAKLFKAVAPSDAQGIAQVAHYSSGIASAEGERASFLKGAVGWGVADRIEKAYEQIADAYVPGDEIYLFGFSRGAFEVRSLASFIGLFGIGKRALGFSFQDAWAQYQLGEAKRSSERLASLRAVATYPARIRCVGVWDTVGNIGNPFHSGTWLSRRVAFHDTRLCESIEIGLHALSIDEQRGPFRPALWMLPEGTSPPPHQKIEQVWFPGTHADVGGGFGETGLSDVALLWMVERVTSLTGLAFKADALSATTHPDPLGAQHDSNAGRIFRWSRIFPFVRLIQQADNGVPAWRRAVFGLWRTGKAPRGLEPVNESVHESAIRRLGRKVIALKDGRSQLIVYRPENLAAVVTEPEIAVADAASGRPRRVKVITVHGTFAHETDWDDWDAKDDAKAPAEARRFINRLAEKLRAEGVTLEAADHVQYNWSGGNSHAERRNAAIGLKKHLEHVLTEDEKLHGKGHYDGVYVVSHSHGGTISRLAMNLWDKAHDYYDPKKDETEDEFKIDDTCDVCKRVRNGEVGPATVPRPDGVITFGSPFVRFEKRTGGLATAWLGAWVFRAFALVFAAILLAITYDNGGQLSMPDLILGPLQIGWPVLIAWLFASFLPGALLPLIDRWSGKGTLLYAVNMVLMAIKGVVLTVVAVYLAAYVHGWWMGTGGWQEVTAWLPFVANATLQTFLTWFTVIGVSLALVVVIPGRFLRWLKHDVAPLGLKLPTKFDPSEDRVVPYLSYHTPGDEAGFGLRVFGALTWLIQTLGLAAASMLALGVILIPFIAIDSVLHLIYGEGLLSPFGVSAFSDNPAERARFITLMDWATYLPRTVLPQFGLGELGSLGGLDNPHEAAWWLPFSIVLTLLIVFLLLMPVMVVLLGIAYLVALWLRRTGLVFGGEGLAWNLSNRIAVSRRPNDNTAMRVMFISPEAWWRKEIAHCYYYKSERVIDDLARSIANWGSLDTGPSLNIGRWVANGASALIVAIVVLSIFATSVPMAGQMANLSSSMNWKNVASKAPPSPPRQECVAEASGEQTANIPAEPVSGRDNLQRIRGIDAPTEEKLNGLGVTTYGQMASWTCAEILKVSSLLALEKRVERENWVQQAGILAQGGTTAYAREFDQQNQPAPAVTLVKDGKNWCLSEPYKVSFDRSLVTESPATRSGSDFGEDIRAAGRPIWEAEVAKVYGPEWASWTSGLMSGCAFSQCELEGKVCRSRSLDCKADPLRVSHELLLPSGLDASAKGSISSAVQSDLRGKWSAQAQRDLGSEAISADELVWFAQASEDTCAEGTQNGAQTRYQCTFAAAPCKDVNIPAVPTRNGRTGASSP